MFVLKKGELLFHKHILTKYEDKCKQAYSGSLAVACTHKKIQGGIIWEQDMKHGHNKYTDQNKGTNPVEIGSDVWGFNRQVDKC